jgi:hypothetical protein
MLLSTAGPVILLLHDVQVPQQPSRTPLRKPIDDAPADVAAAAKIMMLVQLLQIAILRSDGMHTYRYSVDWHLYPLSSGEKFESLALSFVEDPFFLALTPPDPVPGSLVNGH